MHTYKMLRNFTFVLDVLEWILICKIQAYRKMMYTYSWYNHIFKEYNTVVLWDMSILTTRLWCSLCSLIFTLLPSFLNPTKTHPEIYSDLSVSCFFISVISNPQFLPLKNSIYWLISGTIINILHNSHIRYKKYTPPSNKIIIPFQK